MVGGDKFVIVMDQDFAQKTGEVVGPAGGETGVPRCLAEVRMPLNAALLLYL